MLQRWRFAIDVAVVVAVGYAVAALSSKSISWTVAGVATFVAVLFGGACARSFGRALARALLAAGVTLAVVLVHFGVGFRVLPDLFESRHSSAPSVASYYPFFAAGVLVPAVLTALAAQAVALSWRTRNMFFDSSSNGEGLDWAPMDTSAGPGPFGPGE